MKLEKEISVLVICNYKKLHKKLLEHNFEIKEEYQVNDKYMINKDFNLLIPNKLEILSNCILIRDIIDIKKVLLYKYKEYDDNGDILNQGKIECPVSDIEMASSFMKAINYRTLFKIYDKCIVYSNEETELVVQLVNDKYIFIEIEDSCQYVNKKYESVDEMKNVLEKYDLPYDKSNYFAKKALILLNETLESFDL